MSFESGNEKFPKFVAALDALCREYGVSLGISLEGMSIAALADGSAPFDADDLMDNTDGKLSDRMREGIQKALSEKLYRPYRPEK